MHTPLIKSFTAQAAIAPYRIVAFGATDGAAVQASAPGTAPLGVHSFGVTIPAGEKVDVTLTDMAEVSAGAAIARGAFGTTDANGRAVTAATGNEAIGRAMVAATALGQVIPILIIPRKI